VTDLATYVTALDQTWQGMASAVTNLLPAQWDAPTDLPGWSVKDNVAHVAGLESILLGAPYPAEHVVPDYPWLRHDAGRFMEGPVDVRRPLPGPEVLAEFRTVTALRLAALRALPPSAIDDETTGIMGRPMKTAHLLGLRAFDCWAHEQDVRRALGHPGGLSSVAAEVSRRRLLLALTGLAEDVPAAAGRVVVIETTGAIPSVSTLRLGSDASLADGPAASEPDVRACLDFETFMLLGTGRVAYDAVSSAVSLAGDVALGEELMRHLAVTP
jgi:uncharacterized protein (TIGR03083 family)